MGLETATYIKDLVSTNPTTSDFVSQGDDHLRMLKSVLQNTFPSLTGPTLPTSTGTANAQVVTHLFAPTSYQAGQLVAFIAGFTNTGAMTLNVNGLGAKSLFIAGAATVAGAVITGSIITAIYDGTQFQAIVMSNGPLYTNGVDASGNGLVVSGSTGQGGYIKLNTPAAAGGAGIFGNVNNLLRWGMYLADGSAESSGNLGSNFSIGRYSDAGGFIDNPLAITRASGAVTLAGGNPVQLNLNASASGIGRNIFGSTAGLSRWLIQLGTATAESGVNVGSDFQISRYNDNGTFGDTPLLITRSTGVASFSHTLQALGFQCRPGTAGAYRANQFNIDYTGTVPQLWIDATNFGTFSFVSDYRIKRDIAPLPSMWERAKALKPISYRIKDYTPKGASERLIVDDGSERWGFVAHELQETLIEDAASGVKDGENLIQSPNPWTVIATLTKALQEAMERIEALETQLAGA